MRGGEGGDVEDRVMNAVELNMFRRGRGGDSRWGWGVEGRVMNAVLVLRGLT